MRILYFAWLREKIGQRQEELEIPAGITRVSELMRWLARLDAAHAAAFADPARLRCALDQEFAGQDADFRKAREIAFFPPVTGG